MLSRTHISAFVGLVILALMFALWIAGQPVLSLNFVNPFGTVVGLVGGISFVFNKWAWAWPLFKGWFVKRPDLRGTWQVSLKSEWIDPKTNKRIDPIIGYIVIRQTLMHVTVRQMTAESKSHSVSSGITQELDEIFRLSVVYRNEPDINLQGKRSDIHYGAFWLEAVGHSQASLKETASPDLHWFWWLLVCLQVPFRKQGPSRLEGHYWTDRNTRGSMELTGRVREYYESYQDAHKFFTSKNGSLIIGTEAGNATGN